MMLAETGTAAQELATVLQHWLAVSPWWRRMLRGLTNLRCLFDPSLSKDVRPRMSTLRCSSAKRNSQSPTVSAIRMRAGRQASVRSRQLANAPTYKQDAVRSARADAEVHCLGLLVSEHATGTDAPCLQFENTWTTS